MSNAEQNNLVNNRSRSERSQITKQMTAFAQRVCSMLGGVFFVAILTLIGTPSAASAFTFTTIDIPGATLTNAIGINAHGQIVGAFTDAGASSMAFF